MRSFPVKCPESLSITKGGTNEESKVGSDAHMCTISNCGPECGKHVEKSLSWLPFGKPLHGVWVDWLCLTHLLIVEPIQSKCVALLKKIVVISEILNRF